jgi:hypothetical protein
VVEGPLAIGREAFIAVSIDGRTKPPPGSAGVSYSGTIGHQREFRIPAVLGIGASQMMAKRACCAR